MSDYKEVPATRADFACQQLAAVAFGDVTLEGDTALDAIRKHINACAACQAVGTSVTGEDDGSVDLTFKLGG